ncbi:MAG: DUF4040 domain-containing protein [Cyanophyceae cyanobacterium]
MTNVMTDWDLAAITALLPIAAVMTVLQKNPYHALVVRGILGAIAALVYALLGAADVALTEALVGTMLAITLYAVAVRSSLVLKLGIIAPVDLPEISIENGSQNGQQNGETEDLVHPVSQPLEDMFNLIHSFEDPPELKPLLADLRVFCDRHSLRLELHPMPDRQALDYAMETKEVHGVALLNGDSAAHPYSVTVRVDRLYELMQTELNPAIATLDTTTVSLPENPLMSDTSSR